MRYEKRDSKPLQADMTPMIDMTFQLIAFFMVLINFSEADQNDAVKLPSSELAKPPDGPLTQPLFIHVKENGKVIFGGKTMPAAALVDELTNLKRVWERNPERSVEKATVVIRADRDTRFRSVQDVIAYCKEVRFEKFNLRARFEKRKGRK